ncbi:MAG: DUF4919 domain-containing protein [Muribaculaceae bacterium]
MKHFIFSIIAVILVSLSLPTLAQKFEVKAVDFDNIKQETQDPNSQYFFPKLVKEFQSNDTTMTFEQYRYFYYGYIYQEDYNPFRESPFSDMIENLYYKKEFTRAECDTIEKYAELSLDDNIFDLQQMEFYIFALKQKKKYARAAIRQYRLNHIIATILSSGNGTAESPWVVTSAMHEYYILNKLGYVAIEHKSMPGDIDFIAVKKKNDKSPEGFYFDASKIIEVANVKFAE